jgi:hypothetical protein
MAEAVSDLGLDIVRRAVAVDGGGRLDDLADPAGELARGELALPSEAQLLAAQDRDHNRLNHDDGEGREAHPDALDHDEEERRQGLGREKDGLDEGISDEAADRLHLVLDHARHFRRLDGSDILRAEAQQQ